MDKTFEKLFEGIDKLEKRSEIKELIVETLLPLITEAKEKQPPESKLNPDAEAYWITPYGKIMEVDARHINAIIRNPELFGLTREEIVEIYKRHKEPMGWEGKAREEIILELVKRGWIRIRHYRTRNDHWSIHINKLSNKIKDYLQQFASSLIKVKGHGNDDVSIDSPLESKNLSMGQIAQDALYLEEGIKRLPMVQFVLTNMQADFVKLITENKKPNKKYEAFYEQAMVVKRNLQEAKLTRIWQHGYQGFAVFTSFKGARIPSDVSPEEQKRLEAEQYERNIQTNKDLEDDLRSQNLGFIKVLGGWKDKETGIPEYEEGFFVPLKQPNDLTKKEILQICLELAKKFNQEAILIGDPNKDEIYLYYLETGDKEYKKPFRVASLKEILEYWSELRYGPHKKRRFVYDDIK